MTKPNQIYKCEICGNIVELLYDGGGTLSCCDQPMSLMLEHEKKDEGEEKHVPVVEKSDQGITIKVGSVPHPMEKKHYIQWIEIITEDRVIRKNLKPNDQPEIKFCGKHSIVVVRAYCNVHGLWKS